MKTLKTFLTEDEEKVEPTPHHTYVYVHKTGVLHDIGHIDKEGMGHTPITHAEDELLHNHKKFGTPNWFSTKGFIPAEEFNRSVSVLHLDSRGTLHNITAEHNPEKFKRAKTAVKALFASEPDSIYQVRMNYYTNRDASAKKQYPTVSKFLKADYHPNSHQIKATRNNERNRRWFR